MAAKLNGNTASSAFNAYFMQQQTHGPGQHANSEPAVADLHLKMSKKIAQLTKVNKKEIKDLVLLSKKYKVRWICLCQTLTKRFEWDIMLRYVCNTYNTEQG